MSATVTFAIPFYAGTDYLARTLRSVVAQRDDDWHAVVCDDGTEPGVAALVAAIGGGRIAYDRNPRNLGIAGNFNRCVEIATTPLVTVLHADDELMPNYCGTMRAAAAAHPTAAAVFCRAQIIDAHGAPTFSLVDVVKDRLLNPARTRERIVVGQAGVKALLAGNFIMAPTLCFRKAVLGARRFPASVKFVMDWELTMRLLLDGDALVGLPTRCYRYRRHADNATAQFTRTQLRFREESEFYDRMRAIAAARGWDDCVRVASAKRMVKLNVLYTALKQLAARDLAGARRELQLLRDL